MFRFLDNFWANITVVIAELPYKHSLPVFKYILTISKPWNS